MIMSNMIWKCKDLIYHHNRYQIVLQTRIQTKSLIDSQVSEPQKMNTGSCILQEPGILLLTIIAIDYNICQYYNVL